MESAELPTDALTDFAGMFEPSENGLNGNAYDYQTLTTFGHTLDTGLNLSLRWQHLPSIDPEIAANIPDTPITGADSYNLFGLLARYQLGNNLGLRFGIESLLDEEPPLTGRDPSAEAPALPGGAFNTNNYDINGRSVYCGASVEF